jgi:hypothetical protein
MSVATPIPAISIRQPWAELILRGDKTIEIRTWTDSYRGDLYLHTGKSADEYKIFEFDIPDLFRGGYVGIIELAAIIPFTPERWGQWSEKHLSKSSYKSGTYAWVIRKVRRFTSPIPAPGKLGIFHPEPEILRKLERAQYR